MSERDTADRDQAPCSCKIGRTVVAYGIEGLDAKLRARRADGESLRDLERFLNRSLLRRAVQNAGTDVIGDVDAIYDALAGIDVSAGKRTEIRERLEHAGVDVTGVEDAFVSYQTVRSHLNECLDVDTARDQHLSIDDARGTIAWARSRSEGIVDRTIQRLDAADEVTTGDLDVSQVVRVSCADCGATAPVDVFLDDGGCHCSSDGSPE